jgi:hypothetical protein
MRFDPRSKRFEPALGGESAFYAEPSPDGRWLAWVRYPEGTLWKSRPDGSERLQLTTPPRAAHLPRWSPDGKRLVFASWPNPSQQDGEIRTVAADGSETEMIARPTAPGQGYWDASWLTDGSIVFSHLRVSGPRGLLRFDPRTRQLAPISGAASMMYPKCSPQGDLLAVAFDETGRSSWKLRRHGSNEWVDLGTFPHVYPHFTRDGRSVCALSVLGLRVECLSLETRRLSLLAETFPLELARWVVVPWMGLDADDRPFVTVASGRTETLYSLDWEGP